MTNKPFGADDPFWLQPTDPKTAELDFLPWLNEHASGLTITLQAQNNIDLEADDGGGVSLSGDNLGASFPTQGCGLALAPLSPGLATALFTLMRASRFALRAAAGPILRVDAEPASGAINIVSAAHLYEVLAALSD